MSAHADTSEPSLIDILQDLKKSVDNITSVNAGLQDGGNVVVTGSALPTGAATQATLALILAELVTANGHLATIATNTTPA